VHALAGESRGAELEGAPVRPASTLSETSTGSTGGWRSSFASSAVGRRVLMRVPRRVKSVTPQAASASVTDPVAR
jgi:hypothetical protein